MTNVPDPGLVYVWSGAPTESSIVIKFKTSGEQEAQIHLHGKADFSDTLASTGIIKTKENTYFTGTAKFQELEPDTQYHYSLSAKNLSKKISGHFKTLPKGPTSFKIAFASCSRTGSDHPVYRTINNLDPLFFMNIGDFHYENIASNCDYNFASAYFRNLRSHYQAELYSDRPFVYIWDDHDFGPNNSYSQSQCKNEALEAFRQFIPHYPFAFEGKHEPVSQSFTVGRIKFLLTDLRSHKERPEYNGCERIEEGTNFGPKKHLKWFKDQLLQAKDSGQVVAWVNTIPWISDEGSPKYECDENDDWAGFPEERTEIANFIKENNIPIFMLSGDAHMLAIDDGTNSDYADGGGAPIPVFHASPLDQVGILKGGPYSHGVSRKRGQFGLLEVEDTGGNEICITFKGMDSSGRIASNINAKPLVYKFCLKSQRSVKI